MQENYGQTLRQAIFLYKKRLNPEKSGEKNWSRRTNLVTDAMMRVKYKQSNMKANR